MARFLDSELLRRVRVELGLTQEQAAERLEITARAYRRYESGAVNDPKRGFVVRHANRGRVIDRICAEFGLTEDALLRESGAPTPGRSEWRPKRVHPLPRARHFVGRQTLVDELGKWLVEPAPEFRVVALVAIGGAGKTTLLEHLLASIGEEQRESGLLVWSFYEDPRVDAFLREASAYFAAGSTGIEPLTDALGAGPAHVVALDGLEVVQADGGGAKARGELEDATLRRLLRSIAAGLGRTRAILTSRFDVVDLAPWEGTKAHSIRLGELTADETAELLERWGVHGTRNERRRLAKRLGGHALSVAVAGSYSAAFLNGAPLESLDLDEAAQDDPLARRLAAIIEQYARQLSPAERDLMARLSAFNSGASMATIGALALAGEAVAGALAGLTEPKLQRLAARLEKLGLVTRGRDAVLVHPFVRERFLRQLSVPAEELHRVEATRLTSLIEKPNAVAAAVTGEESHLDRAEAMLVATLRGGLVNEAFQVYAQTLGGFPQLGLRSGDMVRGARVLSGFAAGGDPEALDARLLGEFRSAAAYDWGLYAGALGDLTLADRCYAAFERFAREAHGDGAVGSLIVAARARAYVARLRGALREALGWISKSVALAEEIRFDQHITRSLALEASIRHDLGDIAGARERFARVRAIEGEPEARRALWEAEHLLDVGQCDRARQIAERVSETCERLGWEGHVAHARTVLGAVLLAGGSPDVASAREHLARARRWSDSSSEAEVALRVRLLAARIALTEGSLDEADKESTLGLQLAESCGFALAVTRLSLLVAEVALARGDGADALETAEMAHSKASKTGDVWGAADAAHLGGVAALRAKRMTKARSLLARAVEAREALGHSSAQASREELARLDR
jgi:transcriptional regulator with XRE-family HTH domain